MFTYCVQKDTIKVEPVDFGKEPEDALREEIQRRYANKVVANVGLCISVLDILEASEGAVLYQDGCLYHKVIFRLIIFRPFIGELIVGRVRSSSEKGIIVSIGFFDDILIPPGLLPDYSVYDSTKNAFCWYVSNADDSSEPAPRPPDSEILKAPEDQRLYIWRRDWVRIRVTEELWDDPAPSGGRRPTAPPPPPPSSSAAAGTGAAAGGAVTVNGTANTTPGAPAVGQETGGRAPYSLICSMSESGTGVLDWWMEADADEDMQDS